MFYLLTIILVCPNILLKCELLNKDHNNKFKSQFHFACVDPNDEDKITAEGMLRFLEDMNLDPESRVVLLLAWKFKAATQCEFTREEFTTGMADLR